MNYPLFIARRIYSQRQSGKSVSRPAILIAMTGVAIGLAVMIISVCVVLGFQNEVKSKVIGFGSHVQVLNLHATNSYETYPVVVDDSLKNVLRNVGGIVHVQRYCTKMGILKNNENFQGIALKGVGADFDTTFIAQHMVEGTIPSFSDTKSSNKILISKKIATDMNLKVGDKIYSYFIESNIRARRFTVAGIYQTNLSQYDRTCVFADLYTVQRLSGWEPEQVTGVEMQIDDMENLETVTASVEALMSHQCDKNGESYMVMNVKQLNPQIFGWLSLMDLNVWVILVLMIGVASFTMISGLLIIILERTNMIGVLKAMFWGNLVGIGLVLAQKYLGIVHLNPESYYVDTVPVLFNPWLIVLLNLSTLLISVLVLVLPSYIISKIQPAKSIRFE